LLGHSPEFKGYISYLIAHLFIEFGAFTLFEVYDVGSFGFGVYLHYLLASIGFVYLYTYCSHYFYAVWWDWLPEFIHKSAFTAFPALLKQVAVLALEWDS